MYADAIKARKNVTGLSAPAQEPFGCFIMRRMEYSQQLILNRYQPIQTAGSGGFGTVILAWDTRIQRKVAIKVIELSEIEAARAALPGADAVNKPASNSSDFELPDLDIPDPNIPAWGDHHYFDSGSTLDEQDSSASSSNDQAGEQFVRSVTHLPGLDEARTAAMLSDPNIVAVYDFEVRGTTAYLIMEYIEGITLTQLLSSHGDELTLDMVAALFSSVAHALEVAHSHQVLHLDIKPDNVLINPQGQIKVTDFGLAKLADASGFGAAGGGTIGYMPLEQMRQENLDERTDEWALASVMYEMLSGENPFLAPDLQSAEAAIEDAELVLPSLCWDNLDAGIDDVMFYALDPDREERYTSISDFAEELEPFLGDPKEGARELAALVGEVEPEDGQDYGAPGSGRQRSERIPLGERVSSRMRTVAAHVVSGLGTALIAFVACSNIPQISGFENPLFWGLVALITLAGVLKPHLGVLLANAALSIALIAQDAPIVGFLLLVVTIVWWWFIGRSSNAAANAGLTPALSGAVWAAPLGPLVAGFCLPPLRALATAAYGVLMCTVLAALGSMSLLGWEPLSFWEFALRSNIQGALLSLLTYPEFWCTVVSWLVAAFLLALCRLRQSRVLAALGVLVAGAFLVAGVFVAAWIVSGQHFWEPTLLSLFGTIVPIVLTLICCLFIPAPDKHAEQSQAQID